MSWSRHSTSLHALSTVHTYSVSVVNALEREETFFPMIFTPRRVFKKIAVLCLISSFCPSVCVPISLVSCIIIYYNLVFGTMVAF